MFVHVLMALVVATDYEVEMNGHEAVVELAVVANCRFETEVLVELPPVWLAC